MKKKVDSVWQPVKKNDTVISDMHADIGVGSRVNESGSNGIGVRTFRDTLMNKEPEPGLLGVNVEPNTQAFGEWFDCGLIGCVKFLLVLTDLRRIIRNLSHVQINIRYVGGLYVLLVFNSSEDKCAFLDMKELWYDVFSILDEWKGQVLEVERLAWFKIHGVPLSISCPKVFNNIAGKFGELIQSAQFSEDGGDLSYACCGVLYKGSERVNDKVIVNWKGKSYSVLVEEEVGEWIPDCLVDDEDNEDDVVTNIIMEDGNDANAVACEGEMEQEGDGYTGQEVRSNDVNLDPVVNVQEIFSQHFQEGGQGNESRKKRGSFVRKKAARSKSNSPSGMERPKKKVTG
ncbi:hypothetical protein HanHA300_Chr10g0372031 [Helianthus annuus]|nr:hypothetical protein HanHA300_Chr10g0372031 [Helianthus annuus]